MTYVNGNGKPIREQYILLTNTSVFNCFSRFLFLSWTFFFFFVLPLSFHFLYRTHHPILASFPLSLFCAQALDDLWKTHSLVKSLRCFDYLEWVSLTFMLKDEGGSLSLSLIKRLCHFGQLFDFSMILGCSVVILIFQWFFGDTWFSLALKDEKETRMIFLNWVANKVKNSETRGIVVKWIKKWKNFTYYSWSFITFTIIPIDFKKWQFSVSFNSTPSLGFSIKSCQNFQNTHSFFRKKKKKFYDLSVGQNLKKFAKIPMSESLKYFIILNTSILEILARFNSKS
jgi:hypothetical protein